VTEHGDASPGRRVVAGAVAVVAVALALRGLSAVRGLLGGPSLIGPTEQPAAPPDGPVTLRVPDSLGGRSGALRFHTLTPEAANATAGFVVTFGERALRLPAVHQVIRGSDSAFSLILLTPFAAKRGGMLNGYRLGQWPAERWMMARNYFNPDGFVEVTPADTALRLSRRFSLGEFLTHDRQSVWPRYIVLEEKLIDKLELVLDDLAAQGVPTDHVVVLSGFRAPYYNEQGAGEGMARASRHMYGDAADIIVDADGDGRMDDLNRDGKLDLRDTEPITRAIARVEARHPDLVGGVGTYQAMGPRGPFAHIDVRGTSARWERRGESSGLARND
jgi:Peptidase M15